MKERIKEVRKHKNFNQTEFSIDLGVSVSNIQSYETGRRIPSDAFIQLVCSKYGINENWLRTGESEMFAPVTRNDEIANITKTLLGEDNPIRLKLTSILCNLTDEQIKEIYELSKQFVDAVEKDHD